MPTCVSAVPAGTIAAFSMACPAGWTEVAATAGRTLVGAGTYSQAYATGDRPSWSFSQTYGVGQTGGFATWRQNVDEMPGHRHDVVLGQDGSTQLAVVGSAQASNTTQTWWMVGSATTHGVPGQRTTDEGGDLPHENRMPYLVVRWCRKD